MLGDANAWEYILKESPSADDGLISFFKAAARDYASHQGLSREARTLLREYKKLFESFASHNVGNNAISLTANGQKTAPSNSQTFENLKAGEIEKMFAAADIAEWEKPITLQDVQVLRTIGQKSINKFTSAEIQIAQKWAYKFYKELGVKSPFFRAWFGEWRAHQTQKYVRVVGGSNAAYTAGKAHNVDVDADISWGRELKGETINHLVREKASQYALEDIYSIIENAIYFDTVISMPTSKTKMPNTAFMHSFYSLYRSSDGGIHLLKVYIEEALSNNEKTVFKRGYQLKDIIKVADLPNSVLSKTGGLTDGVSTTTYSIADLYNFVKTFDKDFVSAPEVSKHMLNEDGTPKIFYHGTRKENGEFWEFDYSKAKKKGGLGFKSLGAGNYFAANKLDGTELYGSRVIEAYLSVKNPLIVKSGETFRDVVSRELNVNASQMTYPSIQKVMRDAKYDGTILLDEKGEVAIVVTFDSEQVKSAAKSGEHGANIGTFDKNNADIRFALSDKKKAAGKKDAKGVDEHFAAAVARANGQELASANNTVKKYEKQINRKNDQIDKQKQIIKDQNKALADAKMGNNLVARQEAGEKAQIAKRLAAERNAIGKVFSESEIRRELKDMLDRGLISKFFGGQLKKLLKMQWRLKDIAIDIITTLILCSLIICLEDTSTATILFQLVLA